MEILSFLAIPIGYIIGSFPSSYVIVRLIKKGNLLEEGDGHVSATAVYRRAGLIPFLCALILDVGKGALAIYIATLLSNAEIIVLVAGFAAMAGHCWSVFIKFMGGLGASVIYGVIAMLNIKAFLITAVVTIVFFLITRKSSLATILFCIVLSIVFYFIFKASLWLTFFPYTLLLLQLLKRYQIKRSKKEDAYKNEFFEDLKRIR